MGNPQQQSAEDRALVALFAGLDTPGVSDAMDKLDLHGQALGIAPLADYDNVVVGPAFTVKYVPASVPPGTVGDFIDDAAEGDVVVMDNGGRRDCTVWGDIMTQYAGLRGIAGTVIDGVCRDVSKALGDHYPLFTAGRFMRTGKDRVQVETVGGTIAVGTVRVQSRDIVVADANGVVIVPRERAREVAKAAREIDPIIPCPYATIINVGINAVDHTDYSALIAQGVLPIFTPQAMTVATDLTPPQGQDKVSERAYHFLWKIQQGHLPKVAVVGFSHYRFANSPTTGCSGDASKDAIAIIEMCVAHLTPA